MASICIHQKRSFRIFTIQSWSPSLVLSSRQPVRSPPSSVDRNRPCSNKTLHLPRHQADTDIIHSNIITPSVASSGGQYGLRVGRSCTSRPRAVRSARHSLPRRPARGSSHYNQHYALCVSPRPAVCVRRAATGTSSIISATPLTPGRLL